MMAYGVDGLSPETLKYFQFIYSSRLSIGRQFPNSWNHTLIFDLLGAIAISNASITTCNFDHIKDQFQLSDATLERYLIFLRKHGQIEFDQSCPPGRPTNLSLTAEAVASIKYSLAVFDEMS
jgi:hypothetical protein